MNRFDLATGWSCRRLPDNNQVTYTDFETNPDWIAATVPGSIHQDLIAAGQLSDPFWRTNENELQWVGESMWLYRCIFNVPDDVLAQPHVDLCFDGLDTVAQVWLNGEYFLYNTNMFEPARMPAKDKLRPGENRLYIVFYSALKHGKQLEEKYGKRGLWNGDSSRLFVRKAQYHYGWDWGPTLLTAGVWRPVRVEAYTARITDLHAPATVSEDLHSATIPVEVRLSTVTHDTTVTLRLNDPVGATIAEITLPASRSIAHTLRVNAPALWYPNGSGEQPLYTFTVTVEQGGAVLDTKQQRLGLRRLRLVQEPVIAEPGTSFYFEINNLPIFSGGANWIPADSFIPAITPERYRAWLELAAQGNINMLRVWGGGIYEEDIFYDLCDELGLLVWQDFMFACGLYPAHQEFLTSVTAEVEANVRRLRHHPSIVLWCGNNEDYQVAESQGLYDGSFQGDFTQTAFPAREIYERLLPELCATLDPTRPYWQGSPYSNGGATADGTVGDRHTWNVWHGDMADYQNYGEYAGRFVSEFGIASAPHMTMIETFTAPEDRVIDSPVMNHHNKAGGGPERIAHYQRVNLPAMPTTLDEYIYASQFIQSEAMGVALESFRERWIGARQYAVAGALIWQLNDCWPVTSWALADYAVRPKAAYYRTKRALAPIALLLNGYEADKSIRVVNATPDTLHLTLEISAFSIAGAQIAQSDCSVIVRPLAVTHLEEIAELYDTGTDTVIAARLTHEGHVIARNARWETAAYTTPYPDPGLHIKREGDQVTISAERPARGVLLVDGGMEKWSDNMIDVLPGDPQTVRYGGSSDRISVWWRGATKPITVR
jgi:beta-mannosidase